MSRDLENGPSDTVSNLQGGFGQDSEMMGRHEVVVVPVIGGKAHTDETSHSTGISKYECNA